MNRISLVLILLLSISLYSVPQVGKYIHGNLKGNLRFENVVTKGFGVGFFGMMAVSIKSEEFTITTPADIYLAIY
ncbi:MAG: hypothetical protein JZU53_01510 [Paludibacter sp.]|nr:hypothetical protein [Paludibacter sp.]